MTTETSLRTGAKYQSSGRKREFIAAQIAGSLAVVMLVMFPVAAWNAPPIVGETTRLSVASDGSEGNGSSALPAISADGRYVAFESLARNLVSDDTNNFADIFVHDRQTGETTRASVASDGAEANHASLAPGISADGRYVAFWSSASNLVPDDTNDTADIFVRDRHTGETTRVSVSSDGTEANGFSAFIPTISADGRYVAFQSSATNLVSGDTNNFADIFVHDRQTGETTRASVAGDGTEGNNSSDYPSISADGRYVAFHSSASNLVPDDTNDTADIFVHDRQTGETTRVSVASDGTEVSRPYNSYFPSISADGRYVAFYSSAINLVPDDTNATWDHFVHDRQTGETTRVSVSSDGTEASGYSGFLSAISADGRYVSFNSNASNLVEGDTNNLGDVFVHDRQTGETTRASVASDGAEANRASLAPALSADGRYVAFYSSASNLVPDDTNGTYDIFVRDRFPSEYLVLVSDVIAAPNPIEVQGMLEVTATAKGGSNIVSAAWTFNGTSGAMEPADGLFDAPTEKLFASLMAPYEAGVYELCINVTDAAGNTSEYACISVVAFDPSAGFLTGGGWIWSPPGALVADPAALGRANYAFVARYRRGSSQPNGHTRFVSQAGGFSFYSDHHEWLVVEGNSHAILKGTGTLNGANATTGHPYQFILWVGDSDPDTFRIKIWYEDDGDVLVYDNGQGQPIGGGQIVIHADSRGR